MRALALTLPLFLLLWGCEGCDESPRKLAQLIQVEGQVMVLGEAGTRTAQVDEPLFPGEMVTVKPGSIARVRFTNGAEVKVEGPSRFRVNGTRGAPILELEHGRAVSGATESSGGALTVTGRFGRAELPTASAMVFDLRHEEPRLKLVYGEIRVISPQGQEIPFVRGKELVLTLDEPREPSPPPMARAQALVFTLEAEGGPARVRGAQESAFTELAPGQPRELGPGAAFEVLEKGSARLSSEALRVNLSGGSAGAFTGASREGEQRTYALRLSQGQARLQFAPGQHTLKLTDGRGEVELNVSEQSTVSVRDPQQGSTVTVLAGRAELVSGASRTVLQAGEEVNLSSAAAQATRAPAPALMLPPDAKARVFTDRPPSAAVQAPSSSGGPLRVEVAREPSFREPLLAGRAAAEWVRLEPPARGELHWRFLGEDGAVHTQGSARFEADRGRSAVAAESPKAEIMETGLNARVLFQSAAPALHFTFEPREGARSYQLRLYRAADAKTPLLQRVTNKNQYTLEPGALGEGRYLWYVAALGPGGDELAGGRMNKLELVYDNERRGLALSRPRPGERLGKKELPVEGVVPPGSKLFLNGQAVAVDGKGRFSQRLPPTEVLVFRLVSGQSEAYWVRTLRSDRP